jgi:hypothetical protein
MVRSVVTDLRGGAFGWDGDGILAANSGLQKALGDVVAGFLRVAAENGK